MTYAIEAEGLAKSFGTTDACVASTCGSSRGQFWVCSATARARRPPFGDYAG